MIETITRRLASDHCMTIVVVRRWRPMYKRFNRVPARASRRHEYAIVERGSAIHTVLANQRHA